MRPRVARDLGELVDHVRRRRPVGIAHAEVDRLNLAVAGSLAAKVNAIVASLQEVLGAHGLDAASALGRSIRKIEDLTDQP